MYLTCTKISTFVIVKIKLIGLNERNKLSDSTTKSVMFEKNQFLIKTMQKYNKYTALVSQSTGA